MRTLVIVALALALAAPAGASNVATPRMVEVASWAAAKPVEVYCSSDIEDWRRVTSEAGNPSGERAAGFTFHGEPHIYLSPVVCGPLLLGVRSFGFALGLNTLLHEAYTHYGAGVRNEAIQECAALVLQYEALRKFYGVQFFTPLMRKLTTEAIEASRRLPAEYQGCGGL